MVNAIQVNIEKGEEKFVYGELLSSLTRVYRWLSVCGTFFLCWEDERKKDIQVELQVESVFKNCWIWKHAIVTDFKHMTFLWVTWQNGVALVGCFSHSTIMYRNFNQNQKQIIYIHNLVK